MITEIKKTDDRKQIFCAVRNILIIYMLFSFLTGNLHTLPMLFAVLPPVIPPLFAITETKKIPVILKSLSFGLAGTLVAAAFMLLLHLNSYPSLLLLSSCSFITGIIYICIKDRLSQKKQAIAKALILVLCFTIAPSV